MESKHPCQPNVLDASADRDVFFLFAGYSAVLPSSGSAMATMGRK